MMERRHDESVQQSITLDLNYPINGIARLINESFPELKDGETVDLWERECEEVMRLHPILNGKFLVRVIQDENGGIGFVLEELETPIQVPEGGETLRDNGELLGAAKLARQIGMEQIAFYPCHIPNRINSILTGGGSTNIGIHDRIGFKIATLPSDATTQQEVKG